MKQDRMIWFRTKGLEYEKEENTKNVSSDFKLDTDYGADMVGVGRLLFI